MTPSWTIRPATAADIEAVVDLRNEVYGSHVSAVELPWKYFDNPAGGSYLFVAEDGGRIIGHAGYTRFWINMSGEQVTLAYSQDGFVRPDYRRQGVLTALLADLDAKLASHGICASLGLVTPAGKAATLRLGYRSVGRTVWLRMVLNPRAIVENKTESPLLAAVSEPPLRLLLRLWLGRQRRVTGADDITIETVDSFDSRFDELWTRIKESLPFGLWQDAEYLNWRYRAYPVGQYTVLAARKEESLLGFIVLGWGDEAEERYQMGRIVDLLFAPGEVGVATALISVAADYFEDGGANIIACDIFGGGPFFRLFRSCGFFRRGHGLSLVVKAIAPGVSHSPRVKPGN